ncbi:hypothetical protein HZA87_00485 [Candidatus Uhrbacteria bacterium]|nr:hypothetical protein [Candidatus Uhrbacteria bacterium]
MLKKILIFAVVLATLVSPLLPRVFADSGAWKTSVAASAWDYDYFRVERLKLDSGTSGPFAFNDAMFVVKTAESCEYPDVCGQVDLTIFKDGGALEVASVDNAVTDAFAQTAQDGRFIYMVPSDSDDFWGTIYEYDSASGTIATLFDVARADNSLSFLSFATDGDRIYTTTLQSDEDTGDVESALSVYDYGSGYEREDFTYALSAPLQEIVDVQDGNALVKATFDGGYEQLWIVNQTARSVEAIPDTWTEQGADIVGAHYLSDGSIVYFRNFRLWSYTQGVDETPTDAGGAYLTWFEDVADAVQVSGDRMAYIDDENGLYVSDLDGVHKLGVATDGVFNLTQDTIYFQNDDGDYVGYNFQTLVWETRAYHVTDAYDDILIGVDADGNVWYENTTNGRLLNVGFGAEPVLSDREHAYWQGTDDNVYEATFSPLLDLVRNEVEAFSAYNSQGIYLVSGDKMWLIPSEEVYFTWFDSWDEVVKVSQATINVYLETSDYEGDLKFAPGTRVKTVSSAKVYVVGSDYELHWIVSETVADEIYGSDWNQGIIEVNDTYLWKYGKGPNVASGNDVRSI